MWRAWHAAAWGGALERAPASARQNQKRNRKRFSDTADERATGVLLGGSTSTTTSWAEASWALAAGALRGERATMTGLASGVLYSPVAGVGERATRLTQLRLAARAFRLRAPDLTRASRAEWRGLGALVAHAFAAHAPGCATREARDELADAAEAFAEATDPTRPTKASPEEAAERAATRLVDAARACPHAAFRALLRDASDKKMSDNDYAGRPNDPKCSDGGVLAALASSVAFGAAAAARWAEAEDAEATDSDAGGTKLNRGFSRSSARRFAARSFAARCAFDRLDRARRGKCWTLLGLARLHLVVPDGAEDPAGETAARRDVAERRLRDELAPAAAAAALSLIHI